MKRTKNICILLVLALAVCLSGCGRADSHMSAAGSVQTEKTETTYEEPDLNTGIIAVEVGTTTESAARETYPDAEYICVKNAADGYMTVKTGKADAFAVAKSTYGGSDAAGTDGLRVHSDGVAGTPGHSAVAVSPKTGIPDALEQINKFLAEIEADGTLEEMKQRWTVEQNYNMPEIAKPENPQYTMRVGTTGLYEPFSFYQDGAITGFDAELMQRFALWCNAELVTDIYDWDGIVPACATGKADYIMSGLFVTEERAEAVDFSTPYADVETVMVIADKPVAQTDSFRDNICESFEKNFCAGTPLADDCKRSACDSCDFCLCGCNRHCAGIWAYAPASE